jgi:hypothetical protein
MHGNMNVKKKEQRMHLNTTFNTQQQLNSNWHLYKAVSPVQKLIEQLIYSFNQVSRQNQCARGSRFLFIKLKSREVGAG